MITLGGVSLNKNLYLSGLESAPGVVYKQSRTLSGNSILTISPNVGGRTLTLTTQNDKAIQGIWCKSSIDSVKALESLGLPVELDYRGATYQVVIVGSEFKPMFIWQTEGPTKAFLGSLTLIEV